MMLRIARRNTRSDIARRLVSTLAIQVNDGSLTVAKMDVGDKLEPSQVLVKMEAAKVSGLDILASRGLLGAASKVCGNQGVGLVESVGSGVSNVKAGDRVIPKKLGLGTWASYAVADADSLAVVPKDLAVDQLAQIGTDTATAYAVLANLAAGDCVIADAATEGFVQIAKAKGLKIISVVQDNVANFETVSKNLKAAGSDVVVDASTAGSSAFLKECAALKPKLAVHSDSCPKCATRLANALAPGGTLVSVAGAGPVTVPSSLLINRDITIKGFNLQKALDANNNILKEILELVKSGKLKQSVSKTESLENIDTALQLAKVGANVLIKF